MGTVFLFDADTFAHCASAACTKHYPPFDEDGEWVSTFNVAELEAQVTETVRGVCRTLHDLLGLGDSVARAVMCLSDTGNYWRRSVLPTYKEGRTNKPKPTGYAHARRALQGAFESRRVPRLEGDDVLGLCATGEFEHDTTVIVSLDKDMRQVPGLLYNDQKPDLGVQVVSAADGHRFHMLQTLTGDQTDGYSGCPGTGPVGANRLLDENPVEDWWGAIVEQYAKKKLGPDDALRQARVARILVKGDYDWKAKEVRLWTPN